MIQRVLVKGFSLVEIVITISLIAILSQVLVPIIIKPVLGYFEASNRVDRLHNLDAAFTAMAQEIKNALPNSMRITNNSDGVFVEFVPILTAQRYRATGPAVPTDIFEIGTALSQFSILGNFPTDVINASGPGSDQRLVIYHLGDFDGTANNPTAGLNIYSSNLAAGPNPPANTHVALPESIDFTLQNVGNTDRITLSAPFQFAYNSPEQRLYITGPPITFHCNPSEGTLTRYTGYAIQSTQPASVSVNPLATVGANNTALLAQNLSTCDFTYFTGGNANNGILTVKLGTLANGDEPINLLQQVFVSNAP